MGSGIGLLVIGDVGGVNSLNCKKRDDADSHDSSHERPPSFLIEKGKFKQRGTAATIPAG
jgi:hypothetical protein